MSSKKIIMHIDMDYFFAQVEERENPWLKDRAVVVGADPKKGKGRGVVSTCNYAARKLGVKSGMPVSWAYKKAPQAVFLPVNMAYYQKVSQNIFSIVKKITKPAPVEMVSLDEAYIDLTSYVKSLSTGKEIAVKIKNSIKKKESLQCSVGVSENRMLAKIACELGKPDGVTVFSKKKGVSLLEKMSIDTIPGIGPKTKTVIENYIKKSNITVADAKSLKLSDLTDLLGKRGASFYNNIRGEDYSIIKSKREIKSVGREHTFSKDTCDSKKIINTFKKLVDEVFDEISDKKLSVKAVVVVCRFEDFKTYQRQKSFLSQNTSKEALYKQGVNMLLNTVISRNKKIRLIGFRVNTNKKND